MISPSKSIATWVRDKGLKSGYGRSHIGARARASFQ